MDMLKVFLFFPYFETTAHFALYNSILYIYLYLFVEECDEEVANYNNLLGFAFFILRIYKYISSM